MIIIKTRQSASQATHLWKLLFHSNLKKDTYFSLRVCLLDEGHVPLLPGLELVEHVGQDGVLVHHSFKENILKGWIKCRTPPPEISLWRSGKHLSEDLKSRENFLIKITFKYLLYVIVRTKLFLYWMIITSPRDFELPGRRSWRRSCRTCRPPPPAYCRRGRWTAGPTTRR